MSEIIQQPGRQNQLTALASLLAVVNQDREGDVILSFSEWCCLAGIPRSTAREMRARGQGPRFMRLNGKRLGITVAEHRRWMASRMEKKN
jgi:hypothetical protein